MAIFWMKHCASSIYWVFLKFPTLFWQPPSVLQSQESWIVLYCVGNVSHKVSIILHRGLGMGIPLTKDSNQKHKISIPMGVAFVLNSQVTHLTRAQLLSVHWIIAQKCQGSTRLCWGSSLADIIHPEYSAINLHLIRNIVTNLLLHIAPSWINQTSTTHTHFLSPTPRLSQIPGFWILKIFPP